jgi:hypothetical protein
LKTIENVYAGIKSQCKKYNLSSPKIIERGRRTIKVRIQITSKAFIDFRFNEELQELRSALILEGKRIFGINGEAGNWHRHPLHREIHEPIPPIDLPEMFREYIQIIKELKLI